MNLWPVAAWLPFIFPSIFLRLAARAALRSPPLFASLPARLLIYASSSCTSSTTRRSFLRPTNRRKPPSPRRIGQKGSFRPSSRQSKPYVRSTCGAPFFFLLRLSLDSPFSPCLLGKYAFAFVTKLLPLP